MEKAIVYKIYDRGINNLYAGLVISKNKVYKIRPLDTGAFNGYRTLVQPEDVIVEVDLDDGSKRPMIGNILKELRDKQSELEEQIRNLHRQQNNETIEAIKQIKQIMGK